MNRSEVMTAALLSCFMVGVCLITSAIWPERQLSREVVQGGLDVLADDVNEQKNKYRETLNKILIRQRAKLAKTKDAKQIEAVNAKIKRYESFLKRMPPEKNRGKQ